MSRKTGTPGVLFVCMGNICRSPTGEGVLRHLLASRGLTERVRVDSAGTIDYHEGKPADARMRRAAEKRGIELTSRARQVRGSDFDEFDLIVAMDRENFSDLRWFVEEDCTPRASVKLLSEFLPPGSGADVPDPYYGGDAGFEHVLDLVESACPAIIEHLLPGESGGARRT